MADALGSSFYFVVFQTLVTTGGGLFSATVVALITIGAAAVLKFSTVALIIVGAKVVINGDKVSTGGATVLLVPFIVPILLIIPNLGS